MKAKYINEACEAMLIAEELLMKSTSPGSVHVYTGLVKARCNLIVFSGLNDVEVPVEKAEEVAQ